MAFTDDCDLYVAFHEEGVNLVIQHVMRQRPSWFNYASADLAGNRELWCEFFPFTSDVTKYGNPLFTILPPLPVIGADSPPVTLGFIVQITKVTLDFHRQRCLGSRRAESAAGRAKLRPPAGGMRGDRVPR
jgi:hypothetical protein